METLTREIGQCRKCEKYGLSFLRHYKPTEYAEGNPESDIWLIGLNPKGDRSTKDKRTTSQLRAYFMQDAIDSTFESFIGVSERLYMRMRSAGKGVCHTDLFKCYSEGSVWKVREEWVNNVREICENCSEHLSAQIDRHSSSIKMILCNGTKVVSAVKKTLIACGFVRVNDQFTSAEYARDDLHLFVINSGFIGRIDNFAKRRLGMEIEQIAEKAGVQL